MPKRTGVDLLARRISVTALAKRMNVHPDTARAWLKRLDERSGGRVIQRTSDRPGAHIFTTLGQLKRADPTLFEASHVGVEDLARVEEKATEVQREVRAMKARVRELLSRVDLRTMQPRDETAADV